MNGKLFQNGQFKGRQMKKDKNKRYVSGLIIVKESKGRSKNNFTTMGKGNFWSKPDTTNQRLINSKSGLLHLSKEKSEDAHEIMLQNELSKFRAEIERKYKNSKTNKEYIFPRNNNTNDNECINDYSCNFCLIFNSENYTCKY